MKRTFRKMLALVIALMLAIPGTAFVEASDGAAASNGRVAVASAPVGDDPVIVSEEIDEPVTELGELSLGGPDDNYDIGGPAGVNNADDQPAPVAFERTAVVGALTVTVTAEAGVFPEGYVLSAGEVTDEEAQRVRLAAEATLESEGDVPHRLLRVAVLDEDGNPRMPSYESALPLVRVTGMDVTGNVCVLVYDEVIGGVYETAAALVDGAVEFSLTDSAIYDIVEVESDGAAVFGVQMEEEEPDEEKQPSEEGQKPSPSGEGGAGAPDEVVPEDGISEDESVDEDEDQSEDEEETTSSDSPEGEPASPEGEASEDEQQPEEEQSEDEPQKPSPSGESGADAPDEVVPEDGTSEDESVDEDESVSEDESVDEDEDQSEDDGETTSSDSPEGEPASPEGEAFEDEQQPETEEQEPEDEEEQAEEPETEDEQTEDEEQQSEEEQQPEDEQQPEEEQQPETEEEQPETEEEQPETEEEQPETEEDQPETEEDQPETEEEQPEQPESEEEDQPEQPEQIEEEEEEEQEEQVEEPEFGQPETEEDQPESEEDQPEPELEDEQPEDEEPEPLPFDQSMTVGGVVVSVKAEAGAFPNDAVLSVKRVPSYKRRQAADAIDEVREDDVNVAVSYTFDIKVIDPGTKEELQPAAGFGVSVSFALSEAADDNLEASVYHIMGEAGALTAEALDTATDGGTVTATTDGFSLYTVEFTYNSLEYVLPGDGSVPLGDILSALGLTGTPEQVEVSDSSLFDATLKHGEYVVAAKRPFNTEEWMAVTIDGVKYEIAVTDDNSISVEYVDAAGNSMGTAPCIALFGDEAVLTQGNRTGGWYTVTGDEVFSDPLVIQGEVNLVVDDGATLDAKQGIDVQMNAHLIVWAKSVGGNMGTIIANGTAQGHAGIGGHSEPGVTGNITIHGCYVKAKGGDYAPGIWGGTVEIDGGAVDAAGGAKQGSSQPAGIKGNTAVNLSHADGAKLGDMHVRADSYAGAVTLEKDFQNYNDGQVYEAGPYDPSALAGILLVPPYSAYNMVKYVDEAGNEAQKPCTVLNKNTNIWRSDNGTGGWYVMHPGGVEFSNRVIVTGDVKLILCDGAALTAEKGITVAQGDSLTIYAQRYGTGTLYAGTTNGSDNSCMQGGAGIGGMGGAGGTVIVNGGKVYAVGGESGAGIGGGSNRGSGGTVIISGGKVAATGGNKGSGIGGGWGGAGGNITVNGGDIETTGGNAAAGIGGGFEGAGGNITVTGGTVTATGGDGGAGIGGGYKGAGGDVTITGGKVEATSMDCGAGIGGGDEGAGGTVTITGGTVTATGSNGGAGIGGGYKGAGGDVTITGGTVTATGRYYGAGIGGGYKGAGGDVTITGGTVTALCNSGSQPIGRGDANDDPGTLSLSHMKAYTSASATAPVQGSQVISRCRSRSGTYVRLEECDDTSDTCQFCNYGGVSYLDAQGRAVQLEAYTAINSGNTPNPLSSGWYAVTEDAEYGDARLTVNGNVKLVLCDGWTLGVPKGITVSEGNTLTVYAGKLDSKAGEIEGTGALYAGCKLEDGTLTTTCGDNDAGIGGGSGQSAGTIIIHGGKVTATGGSTGSTSENNGGAGIGGGNNGAGGTVTIYGGTVTANGGKGSAGIGGGSGQSAGTVIIHDGKVTATGGTHGAGIGGGRHGAGGTVNITGGTVHATGSRHGAGIGGGHWSANGAINITGGTVHATGGYFGAGIGNGYDAPEDSVNGAIAISGGTVIATGVNGAGIGTCYSSAATPGDIIITGGKVTATSKYGAGIGRGYLYSTAAPGTIILGWTNRGDTIFASGYDGAVKLTKDFLARKGDSGKGALVEATNALDGTLQSSLGGMTLAPMTGDSFAVTAALAPEVTGKDVEITVEGIPSTRAVPGATVTLKVPKTGSPEAYQYGLCSLKTDEAVPKPVDFTVAGDCVYTFTMPYAGVNATFTQWAKLQEALNAGGTVTLGCDVTAVEDVDVTALTVPSGVTATLDLNGHTIDRNLSAGDLNGNVINVEGELTLKDGSGNNTGVVKGGNHGSSWGGGVLVTGKFNMTGGTIKENIGSNGGGVYVSGYDAVFNLSGGVISENTSKMTGGGVFVDIGTFNMTGGVITGNHSGKDYNGGGVYVSGAFNLSGGEITGNAAGENDYNEGGGVYVYQFYSAFSLSGDPVIKNNTAHGAASNVYLDKDKTISVTGKLDNTEKIGVKMLLPGVFTEGLAAYGDNTNFTSDIPEYPVELTEEGEARLGVHNLNVTLTGLDGLDGRPNYTFTVEGDAPVDGNFASKDQKTFTALDGKTVTLELGEFDGVELVYWVEDGKIVSRGQSASFVMDANRNVTVVYMQAAVFAKVDLNGREWADTDAFSFKISLVGSGYIPWNWNTVTITDASPDHAETFGNSNYVLAWDAGQTYTYKVAMTGDVPEGIVLDKTEQTVSVTITEKAGGGTIEIKPSRVQTVTFTNIMPVFTAQPKDKSLTYGQTSGEALSVAVNELGSCRYTYGWYACDADGGNMQVIDNAHNSDFPIPADLGAGEHYYVCKVGANYNNGENIAYANSRVAKVTVKPAPVTLTANSDTLDYNGREQALTGYASSVANLAFTGVSAEGAGTDAGDYPVTFDGVKLNETKDDSGNYVVTGTTDGTLTIAPIGATVTITGATKTAAYNGRAQKATGYTATADTDLYDVAKNIAFTGKAEAERTDVGETALILRASQFRNTSPNFANVTFEVTNGWLKIAPIVATVTVRGATNTAAYDGQAHAATGYTATANTPLYDVTKDFTFTGNAVAERADAGKTGMGLSASQFKNTNGNFRVVTFDVTDGWQEITKIDATVTITGATNTAAYNGRAQKATGYAAAASTDLYDVEKDIAFSGNAEAQRTDVGKARMGLNASQFRNTNANFDKVTFEVTDGWMQVTPAAITITADDKASQYGAALLPLTCTVGGAYTDGDDLGIALSTAATRTSNIGAYPITVSWNKNPNYTATLVNGVYTITRAAITLTAGGYSGVYDGKAHGITVTASGKGVKVYYGTTRLTAANYATAGSAAPVTRTDAGTTTVYYYAVGDNYEAVAGSRKIEISRKPVRAVADAKRKTYGDADPALTYTVTGLVGGDSLSGSLGREAGEDVGSYAITQGTLKASGNYSLAFTGAKLTIVKKALKVTADDKTKVEGTKDPALTYTVTGLVGGDKLTGALTRKAGETPGAYAITRGTLKASGNYDMSFTGATLTITARPVEPADPDIDLRAVLKPEGKTALKLSWTKVRGAKGYDVFFARCGSKDCALVASVSASKARSYSFKGLKANSTYKACVRAWKKVKGVKTYIGAASPTVHCITGGYMNGYCNAKSVKVKKANVTLAAGKSARVNATVTGVKAGKMVLRHGNKLLRYYSSDRNIATVNGKGAIKAVASGTCTITVMANNGVCAKVKVKVVYE